MGTPSIILLISICSFATPDFGADTATLTTKKSHAVLVTEMSDLIRKYAYFHAGSAVFRYDSRVDTIGGIRLFVGEQVSTLGSHGKTRWYYIDFTQPIQSKNLSIVMGRNDNFMIVPAKAITHKVRMGNDVNRKLFVRFFTRKANRPTDFSELYRKLDIIISRLTVP